MKFIASLLILASVSTFATGVSELSQDECTRKCQIYSYNFEANVFGYCEQVEKCDIFSWNSEEDVCEVVKKGELVTFPIACRDIPPY